MHNYFDANKSLPPQMTGEPSHSWRIDILPLMDGGQHFLSYRMDQSWDGEANSKMAKLDIPGWRCDKTTTIKDAQGRYFSSYLLPLAERGIYSPDGPLRLDKIPDGMGVTMLVVENCDSKIVWTQPRDINVDPSVLSAVPPAESKQAFSKVLSSPHQAGANALLADGRVQYVSEKMSPAILSSLILADDGKPVDGDF